MQTPRLILCADERARRAEARVGEVIAKWRLERLIGVGGMAAVFEASHANGSRVAIKILHPDVAGVEELRERFLTEGYAANRVAHPGAVAVRDEGTTEDGAVYLVMDLLRGRTVAERLARSDEPFSVGEVLEIASQLLDVLAQAHDRGIVHRDIKPENVFLTHDGRVRLLDFGIAQVGSAQQRRAVKPGTTLGTPAFMPPEQALGHWEELDGRSDLWSLGATMYLLMSGTPVRERGSATEQLLGAMTRPVPSLGDRAALPRSVIAVVDRALCFERAGRFPDARSMQLAVRAALEELSPPASGITLPPPSVEARALSVRPPSAEERGRLPSLGSVRPVALTAEPAPASSPGALPLYLGVGLALGIGLVVAARLTAHAEPPDAASLVPPALELAALPAPSASSAADSAYPLDSSPALSASSAIGPLDPLRR